MHGSAGRHLPFRARSECLCYRVFEPLLVLVNTRSIDIEPTKHAHKIIKYVPANGGIRISSKPALLFELLLVICVAKAER